MATTVSFKQPCPSCEHPVPIRDPKLIGRKIDCPKCKYRFVVEEPPAEDADPDTATTAKKPANGKAPPAKKPMRRRDEDDDDLDDAKPKKKEGGMSPIMWMGIGLAAIALIGLGITLVLMLSGDDEKPAAKAGAPGGPAKDPSKPADEPKKPVAADAGEGSGGDLVGLTNLVPNEADVVRDAKLDKVVQSDLGDFTALDAQAGAFSKELFKAKFGFGLESVARHIQAQNVKQDWVFNVLRTKTPIDWDKLKSGLGLEKGPRSPIEGKEYFTVRSEPDAFGRFWFSDLFLFRSPALTKPVGVYQQDAQTLVLADLDQLEKYLQKPPTKSETTAPPPAGAGQDGPGAGGAGPGAGAPGGMGPGAPGGMGPGGGGRTGPGAGAGMGPGAGAPGAMGPGGQAGSPPPPPAPTAGAWLTLKPNLKAMLDHLEASKPPILAVVMDGDAFTTLWDKSSAGNSLGVEFSLIPAELTKNVKTAGAAVHAAKLDRLTATVAVEYGDESQAKKIETDFNEKWLPLARTLLQAEPYSLAVRQSSGQGQFGGGFQGGGMMGNYGGGAGYGGGSGGGMSPPGSGGGMSPPGSGGGMSPPGSGGGMSPPGAGGGMSPPGSGGGMRRPGAGGGMSPPGSGGGMSPPGSGFPGGADGQPGAPGGSEDARNPESSIGVSRSARLVMLDLDIAWTGKLRDDLTGLIRENLVLTKAKTEMSDTRSRVHQLAAALRGYTDKHHAFPRGTYDRRSTPERFNRPWAPDQRVSWMAEVVRYLPQYAEDYRDKTDYPLGIDPSLSWNDRKNMRAARMLVPQFLAPKSPELLWSVPYPKVQLPVGATHYVGVAGIGLDAGEQIDPKRRGVFGYDRVTQLAEITDKPENTIAVLQVPPEYKTPWLAGGGSTVRGVPEKDSIRPFVCTERDGKRGTYAVMANGDVRFVHDDIPDALFQAMVTIAGGEEIAKKDLDKYAPVVKGETPAPVAKAPPPAKPDEKAGGVNPPAPGTTPPPPPATNPPPPAPGAPPKS